MGVSSLILFLAMIFVAAISANVLMQTSISLQSKALSVGKQTQSQITTFMSILSIHSDDGSDSDIENSYINARLSPGSENIKLNDTTVMIYTSDKKAELLYKEGPCSNSSEGFSTDIDGKGYFTVEFFKNATDHKNGYLLPGEIIRICLELPENIGESREIKYTIVPRVGMPISTTILTPSTIVTKNVYLYP